MDTQSYNISKKESDAIGLAKIIATLLVIYIHADKEDILISGFSESALLDTFLSLTQVLSQIIARSAVPLFFFFSALLLYKRKIIWLDNIKKKTLSILLPYFIMNTFWILFYVVAFNAPVIGSFFQNESMNVISWGGQNG